MNKPLIITIATGILILSIGSWLYLLFFGAPQTADEIFTTLRSTNGEQAVTPVTTDEETTTSENSIALEDQPLEQLTLRPVAGHVLLPDKMLRYVEQGTGHVYEINLRTSTERRLTNTSIPTVGDAVFSNDGTYVALISNSGNSRNVVWGGPITSEENGSLTTEVLPPMARNVSFVASSSLHFTYATNNVSTLYKLNTATGEQRAIATIPLQDITLAHNSQNTYVVPRPDPELQGNLFTIEAGVLNPGALTAYGLNVLAANNWLAYSYTSDDTLRAAAVSLNSNNRYDIPVVMTPEKCAWQEPTLWCAAPLNDTSHTYQKDWYQGALRSNDVLWQINPSSKTATLAMRPNALIGRPLDITKLQVRDDQMTFINKLDNTLWRYDTSR